MGYIVIAPVGDNLKALFVGIKEFPTQKIILVTPSTKIKEAKNLQEKLKEFTIESEIKEMNGNVFEDTFRIFGEICSLYNNDDIIVNVATGDKMTTCASLSASYANGLKTFGVMDGKTMLLPIMKLSYYGELSDNKMKILNILAHGKWVPLKDLSTNMKMSISLASYHINGNYKYKGMKELRLVEVKENNNALQIKISELGNLLLKGYIKPEKKSMNKK